MVVAPTWRPASYTSSTRQPTRSCESFEATTTPIPGVGNNALSVAISPDGTRAYVGVFVLGTGPGGFTAGGNIVLVDTASESVGSTIFLGSVPGELALTPDGSRLYVGIDSTFVDTGYGSGFFPGSHIVIVDTVTDAVSRSSTSDAMAPTGRNRIRPRESQ